MALYLPSLIHYCTSWEERCHSWISLIATLVEQMWTSHRQGLETPDLFCILPSADCLSISECMKGVTAVCPRPQSSYIRHGVNNNDNTVSRWRQGYLLTITNTQDHQDPLLLPEFLLLLSSSVITTNQCCLGAFHSLIPWSYLNTKAEQTSTVYGI